MWKKYQNYNRQSKSLSAVVGSIEYKRTYIQEKISQWIKDLQMLCKIAWFDPQSAYSCFMTGFVTIPNISSHLKQLDEVNSFQQ